MGRYEDEVKRAVDEGRRREQARLESEASKEAQARQAWNEKAEPLQILLSSLKELQIDIVSREVEVVIKDFSEYGRTALKAPEVHFQLRSISRTGEGTPVYKVTLMGAKFSAQRQNGGDFQPIPGFQAGALTQVEVDALIKRALNEYPW